MSEELKQALESLAKIIGPVTEFEAQHETLGRVKVTMDNVNQTWSMKPMSDKPHPWTLAARQAKAKAAHLKTKKKTAKKAVKIIEKLKGGKP